VLVVEVLVVSIVVRVEVNIGGSAPVGVLRVADARDLLANQAVGEHFLRVIAGLLTETAYGLVGGDGLGVLTPMGLTGVVRL
jgi:hypothetical protein